MKRALHEKVEGEKELWKEIQKFEDAAYVCYEQGFDEALAQVKHFTSETPIDLSRVDRERKLDEIMAERAPTNQDALELVVGLIIQIGMEEDKDEEGGNPYSLLRSVIIFLFLYM